MPRKAVKDMIEELQSWLPNYDRGPREFPDLLFRILASLPGGEELEDIGYETFNISWKEAELLEETLAAIQDKRDVEDLVRGLLEEEDEEDEGAEEDEPEEDEEEEDEEEEPPSAGEFHPGDRVRVVRGKQKGLTGIVAHTASGPRGDMISVSLDHPVQKMLGPAILDPASLQKVG